MNILQSCPPHLSDVATLLWKIQKSFFNIIIHILQIIYITHTHTHTFNGPFSGTTQVSWYQKVKTNLDFTEPRDSELQWYQLGHMQVCTLLQTDNHASTPPLSFLQAGCPSCHPTNSVKAPKGKIIYITHITLPRKKTNSNCCSAALAPYGPNFRAAGARQHVNEQRRESLHCATLSSYEIVIIIISIRLYSAIRS